MSDRFASLRAAVELAIAIGLLEAARRTERGIDARFVAIGTCVGAGYQHARQRHVGGLRSTPLRAIAFEVVWNVAVAVGARNVDESAQRSHGAGVGIGSAARRLWRQTGDRDAE